MNWDIYFTLKDEGMILSVTCYDVLENGMQVYSGFIAGKSYYEHKIDNIVL
jgi:hypothetical protein